MKHFQVEILRMLTGVTDYLVSPSQVLTPYVKNTVIGQNQILEISISDMYLQPITIAPKHLGHQLLRIQITCHTGHAQHKIQLQVLRERILTYRGLYCRLQPV